MTGKERLLGSLRELINELRGSPRANQVKFFEDRLNAIISDNVDTAQCAVDELRSCAPIAQYAGFSPKEEALLNSAIDQAIKYNPKLS